MAEVAQAESPLRVPRNDSATPDPAAAKLHKPGKNAPTAYRCNICGALIKYRSNFLRHMERQHKPKRVVCPKCGKAFRDNCELRAHLASGVHVTPPRDKYRCATCGGDFTSQKALLHHSHDRVSAFPCDVCRRRFQTAVVCAAHRRRHFWRGLARCRACGATFASEKHLTRHIGNHERETTEVVRY